MNPKDWKKLVGIVVIALGAMCFIPSQAYSSEDGASSEVMLKTRHIFESDVEATSNQIEINESQLEFRREIKAGELPLTFGFVAKHIDINEDLAVELPSHLEGDSLILGTKFPMPFSSSDRYFVGVDIFPSMYTDDGEFKSGAFRIPFRVYGIYKESADFIVIAGVSIRPDYDTTALPILGIIYRPNDRLMFNLASDDPYISYKLNEQLTALWEIGFVTDEYEVTRDGQGGVVLKYSELSTGVGLRYDVTSNLQTSLAVGGVFSRRIEYRDDVGKVVADGGLYTNFKISAKF